MHAPRPTLSSSIRAIGRMALVAAVAAATGCPQQPESVSTLEAELEVRPQQVTFNPLYVGVPQTRRVRLNNAGTAPLTMDLTLKDVEGFATFSVSPNQVTIDPGAEVTINVAASVVDDVVGAGLAALAMTDAAGQTRDVTVFASIRPQPSCDDDNPCTIDGFDAETQSCTHEEELDFTQCDDGNACTERTMCRAGQCVGDVITCSDEIACTVDSCDPQVGCVYTPAPSRCDDADPCTDDICRQDTGCENPPLEEGAMCASDGCATFGICQQGMCQHYPVPDGAPCDDADSCTTGDTCQAGTCTAGTSLGHAATDPIPVGTDLLRINHCDGDGASGNCVESVMGHADKVLAVHEAGTASYIVWRTQFLDPWSGSCLPALAANEEGFTDRPSGEDCAATVALTTVTPSDAFVGARGDGSGRNYTHTTVALQTVRGPAAASFTQAFPGANTILGPTDLVLATANPQTETLLVEMYTVGGIRQSRSTFAYRGFHTMPQLALGELAVNLTPSQIVVVAGTADARSCPNCDNFDPDINNTQEMRVYTIPLVVDVDIPGGEVPVGDGSGAGAPVDPDSDSDGLNADREREAAEPPPPPLQEGLPLFVESSAFGPCFTPQGQVWTNAALVAFSDAQSRLTLTAPTDSCGGEQRTYVIDFNPSNPPAETFFPIDSAYVGQTIHGISSTFDDFGNLRQVYTAQRTDGMCQQDFDCDGLCDDGPDVGNGCCGGVAELVTCFTVEELLMDDFGPPRIWTLEGDLVPQALGVVVDGEPWVVAARENDTRLLQPQGVQRAISSWTTDGRTWRAFNAFETAPVSGQSMVGILEFSPDLHVFPEEPELGGEPDVPGDQPDIDGDGIPDQPEGDEMPPVPPDPIPAYNNVGVQFLGCSPN